MDVRRARLEDARAIAQVHAETWREAYEHVFGAERLASVTVDARLAQWERILATGQSDVFVVGTDGIVGFVSTGDSRDADAEAELFAIYVLPPAWGTGAGSALMRAGVEASVLLLAFLPFVFLVTLQLLAPALLTPLRSPFGEALFGLAVAWMVAGYRLLQRMSQPPREERVRLRESIA